MADGVSATIFHASCVALNGGAVLILGQSGAGKSALALNLMAFGAELVADDRTEVYTRNGAAWARAPESIRGLIEARGIGILKAAAVPTARIDFVVDLDQTEEMRLPPQRKKEICGVKLPCVHKIEGAHFSSAILQYLKGGRQDIE